MSIESIRATGADWDEDELIQFLDELLQHKIVRAFIDAAIARIELRLQDNPVAVMGWEPIALDLYGGRPLPASIRSSWVFVLRAQTATGAERHPNSRQRMVSYRGSGDLQTKTADSWESNALISDAKMPPENRWISVPENVWHQAVTAETNWAVVSFHGVPADELIEERPDPDRPGSTRQKRYLETT